MDKSFHHNATPKIFENARQLKNNQTHAEDIIWQKLRRKQLKGLKFRRQHPIDQYILDFYCHELKVAIEVDGCSHNDNDQNEYDIGRTCLLNELGIKVLRFTNEEIFIDINYVMEQIANILEV